MQTSPLPPTGFTTDVCLRKIGSSFSELLTKPFNVFTSSLTVNAEPVLKAHFVKDANGVSRIRLEYIVGVVPIVNVIEPDVIGSIT